MLIFVSYARNDNLRPLNAKAGGYGFVSTVIRSTERNLTDAGVEVLDADQETPDPNSVDAPWAAFFVDTRDIAEDAQFDDVIQKKLEQADVFMAVLSNNWIHRQWCLKELQRFAQRFPNEADARSRIVVVRKHDVKAQAPPLLQGQEGVSFFRPDKDELGGIFEYFKFNEGPREGFDDAVDKLANVIERRVRESPPPAKQDKSLRRVFVAKPAPDMDKTYRNFVQDMAAQGFTIVPDPAYTFSGDMTEAQIAKLLDQALYDAELSIHLLGNSRGFTPADGEQTIVQLQAARAAARRSSRPANASGVAFRRLFWAPKDLIVDDELVQSGRDSQDVCDRVAGRIEGDDVFGAGYTKFAQFVIDRLAEEAPQPGPSRLAEGANVYIEYQPLSEDYAGKVGRALRARNLVVDWQRQAGPNAALKHRKSLQECDAVVVCWDKGDDDSALSPFDETKDLRQLNRERDFACRSLVVGPPKEIPGKTMALSLAQSKDDGVDLVLDLTMYENEPPPPSAFDPLVQATVHPPQNGAPPP